MEQILTIYKKYNRPAAPKLLQLARELPQIVGHEVPGQVAKAGSTFTLHPEPSYVDALRNQI